MHVLILGAAGMIGRKLIEQLIADNGLGGKIFTKWTLYDVILPEKPDVSWPVEVVSGDISSSGQAEKLVSEKPDVIFHLAAIVSGEAEMDFDKGYRINLDGSRLLFEAIRAQNYMPRVVFTSSIAVFGAPFPNVIEDEFLSAPLTSYGVAKACTELMLMDYTRKGFFDGISIRLPTIVIRPGQPNAAASGFFSNILREPLAGQEAILPVSRDVRHWLASPQAAVGFLIHAATLEGEKIGARRNLTMPGNYASIQDMMNALANVAGSDRLTLIREEPDETIIRIVAGWPRNFNAQQAIQLGFKADNSIEEVIEKHINTELGGKPL